jgi:LAO/AO transport system kinase
MIQHYRAAGKRLGVLAVDPTSPFSGGAMLGDRVRMQRHGTDPEVFIRSLATRGHFGGVTRSTQGIIDVLDAMGKDIILVETVGVGQDEVDIVTTAHTTIITVIPGMGDDIQAIKAGILEVADIFVINKADREGVDRTRNELQNMLEMSVEKDTADTWVPPIVETEAIRDRGVDALLAEVEAHKAFLLDGNRKRYKERLKKRAWKDLTDTIKETVTAEIIDRLTGSPSFHEMLERLVNKETDPFTLCETIMEDFYAREEEGTGIVGRSEDR